MFRKNDPMLGAIKGIIDQSDAHRKAVASVNEQFGVYSRRALPLEKKAEYDIALKDALASASTGSLNEEVDDELLSETTKLMNKYNKNEDNNYHAENRVLLAKHFGTPEEHEDAKALYKQHMKQGYLPYGTPLYNKVTAANERHFKALKDSHEAEQKSMRDALKPKEKTRTGELDSRLAKAKAIASTIKSSDKKGNTYGLTIKHDPRHATKMYDDGKRHMWLKGDSDHNLNRVKNIVAKVKGEKKNIAKQGKLVEDEKKPDFEAAKARGEARKVYIAKKAEQIKKRKEATDHLNEAPDYEIEGGAQTYHKEKKEWTKHKEHFTVKAVSRQHALNKAIKKLQKMHPGEREHEAKIVDPPMKESEQLDEVSKSTLARYIKKANYSQLKHVDDANTMKNLALDRIRKGEPVEHPDHDALVSGRFKSLKKARKRYAGIQRAVNKLVKENEQLDEVSKDTLRSYVKKARDRNLSDATKHKNDQGDVDTDKMKRRQKFIDKAEKQLKEDTDTPTPSKSESLKKMLNAIDTAFSPEYFKSEKEKRMQYKANHADFNKWLADKGRKNPHLKEDDQIDEADKPSYKHSYSKSAVDKEIKKDKRIKGKEAKMIHALLKGRQKSDEPLKEGEQLNEMPKVHDWHSGAQLHPDDQKHVLSSYVHRYTKEHKPKWANEKRPDGREYQPHHETDADWLKHTKFAVKKDGRLDSRVRHSQSTPSLKLDETELELNLVEKEIAESINAKYQALTTEDRKEAFVNTLSEDETAICEKYGFSFNPMAAFAPNAPSLAKPFVGSADQRTVTVPLPPAPVPAQRPVTPTPAEPTPSVAQAQNDFRSLRDAANSMMPKPPSVAQAQSDFKAIRDTANSMMPKPPSVAQAQNDFRSLRDAANAVMQKQQFPANTPTQSQVAGANQPVQNQATVQPVSSTDTSVGKEEPTPVPAAQTPAAKQQTRTLSNNRRSPSRVRAPMAPKKKFGFGSGGSGAQDAGSITNRALGAVNEEVEKPEIKRSLESFLRSKYLKD